MSTNPTHWNTLAARARHGEYEAAAQLRDELAPQMTRLVRRTLRSGTTHSPLDRQILSEADRTLADHPECRGRDCEEMVQLVTQRLCARLLRDQIHPLQPTRRFADTFVR